MHGAVGLDGRCTMGSFATTFTCDENRWHDTGGFGDLATFARRGDGGRHHRVERGIRTSISGIVELANHVGRDVHDVRHGSGVVASDHGGWRRIFGDFGVIVRAARFRSLLLLFGFFCKPTLGFHDLLGFIVSHRFAD
jgi:hypothetical protein